jgi:hypothetical protein
MDPLRKPFGEWSVLYDLFVPANGRDWTNLSQLPEYPNSLMVRTDFEHEAEWQAVLNPLIEALPERYRHSFFLERRSSGRSAIFSSDCNAVLEA